MARKGFRNVQDILRDKELGVIENYDIVKVEGNVVFINEIEGYMMLSDRFGLQVMFVKTNQSLSNVHLGDKVWVKGSFDGFWFNISYFQSNKY